jgi:hypothetical protein
LHVGDDRDVEVKGRLLNVIVVESVFLLPDRQRRMRHIDSLV